MVKITKKTIYYEGMPLRPLKMGKISILTGKNLAKKLILKRRRIMGKLKVTLVRKVSQLPKLKSTGYSIILGRNLVKKQKEKKGEIKWQKLYGKV